MQRYVNSMRRRISLNIFYLINSLHVYKQEHTYKSITEFINWDSERILDDLFKSVSQQIYTAQNMLRVKQIFVKLFL